MVHTGRGPHAFTVQVADTEEEREVGLMFVKRMPADRGMVFEFAQPAPQAFWMRNTFIPLDLIFMDEAGVIRHIHRNAVPLDETPISGAAVGDPSPERRMILEIAGGEAGHFGLAVGQAMAHPALDQDLAELPCR